MIPSLFVHDILAMFLLLLAGAGISTLGAMVGLGGGFLAVPFLMLIWGLDSDIAVLTSLTMILANSTSSSITYLRSKMVDLKVFALLVLPSIPGLFLGWWLLSELDDNWFRLIFSVLMIIVMTYVLIRNQTKQKKGNVPDENTQGEERRLRPVLSIPTAFLAGTASSAFGIGGGALLMPLQVGLLQMAVKRAIATSMFLIAVMSAFRVIVISQASFDIFVAIPFALGALIGGQMAVHIVKRWKSKYLLYILSAFLFIIAIFMGMNAVISMV